MGTKQELLTLNGKEYLLDIEQAEKLGLLKEKDSRVRSWKDFTKKYDKAWIVNETSAFPIEANVFCTQSQLTVHEAKALAAFSKLIKLRRDWIGEWEPDWEDIDASYGVIWINKNKLQANAACTPARSLSFPTEKMAQEFLETFSDLIEEAKILI
jgi:prolyl oligopeptidase PreP (S9A serine peptidase family)